jgi:CBS domain-containing protein
MKSPTVRALLSQAHLDDLLKKKTRPVITVRNTVTVEAALAMLAKNRILSAPMLTQVHIGHQSHAGDTAACP